MQCTVSLWVLIVMLEGMLSHLSIDTQCWKVVTCSLEFLCYPYDSDLKMKGYEQSVPPPVVCLHVLSVHHLTAFVSLDVPSWFLDLTIIQNSENRTFSPVREYTQLQTLLQIVICRLAYQIMGKTARFYKLCEMEICPLQQYERRKHLICDLDPFCEGHLM